MLLLKCDDFNAHLIESLCQLRQNDEFTDVTLTCDVRNDRSNIIGFKKYRQFKAHKILLSIASPYFKDLFVDNPSPHPVIMLRHTYAEDLESILEFIYQGEAQISEDRLDDFLDAAKFLQVYGYLGKGRKSNAGRKRKAGPKAKIQRVIEDSEMEETIVHIDAGEEEQQYLEDDDDDDFQVDDEGHPIKAKSARSARSGRSLRGRRKKQQVVTDDPEDVGRIDCRTCKLNFWSAASRRTHEAVHQEETSCATCEKVFSHPVLLAEHIKRSHTQHEVMQEPELIEDLSSERNQQESEVDAVIRELGISEMEAGSSTEKPQGTAEPLFSGQETSLSPEDAFAILNGDEVLCDGESTKPHRPKGGDVFVFAVNNKETVYKQLNLDGYKWQNKNTVHLSDKMSKIYFYARTPEGTMNDFFKHMYILDDESRVLIHYLGDETKYVDFRRGTSIKKRMRQKSKMLLQKSPIKFRIEPMEATSQEGATPELVTVYSYKDIVYNPKLKLEK